VNPNNLTNEDMDWCVLAAIRKGSGRAAEIEAAVFAVIGTSPATMRAVDRTLQRLRKRGAIELHGAPRRWRVKP
jgi:hypothetical protein